MRDHFNLYIILYIILAEQQWEGQRKKEKKRTGSEVKEGKKEKQKVRYFHHFELSPEATVSLVITQIVMLAQPC